MPLSFDKYHGIGNDFLVVHSSTSELTVARAMQLCDRHFGVGADGVLIVGDPRTSASRATMSVINADGSRPEMCGNGLRCVALHLAREANEERASLIVDTDAGPLRCDVERKGASGTIGTEIGTGKRLEQLTQQVADHTYEFSRISTGNPHAICFREPMENVELDRVGPAVSSAIAGGANVEIATLLDPTEIRVTVWERGVGRTLACGTGAAATVIAAAAEGRSPFDVPVTVRLPGGPLEITVTKALAAYLRGPAEWVYAGTMAD